ncbi:MAG: helix-turn-helix domain-containing protein [Bryobacteraceae bacterium]
MAEITIDSYVFDVLMRDLIGHDKSPSAFLVYLHIWSQTFGKGQESAALSHQRMAESTGLSKSAVQGAVRILCRRRLLRAHKPTVTSTPQYTVQRPWRRQALSSADVAPTKRR